MRRHADPTRQSLADLQAFYVRVDAAQPGFSCPRRGRCCQLRETGREPYLWKLEWRLLEQAIAERGGRMPAAREDGGCRFLAADGRSCSVYDRRPFGCRTYGCELASGTGKKERERLRVLTRELTALAETFDPVDDGPRPLSRFFEGVA
jgi:Fe-S-cluster containining protein